MKLEKWFQKNGSVRFQNYFIHLEKIHLLAIKKLSRKRESQEKGPGIGMGTFQTFNITEAKTAKNPG